MHATIRFGNVEVRPAERRLLVDRQPVELGARAFDLLLVLIEHRDRIVSKDELLQQVWPGLVVEDNNLHVHVSAIRKLIGSRAISTVAGRGYRFVAQTDHQGHGHMPVDLIGREQDLQALATLVAAHRAVTVVGAGGIGKTRLAQAFVQRRHGQFADGAGTVELATVTDPALLPATVAHALGASLTGHKPPLDEVVDLLRPRHLLLVLDNCEHLVDAVGRLVEAVHRHAPGVHILATSQTLLMAAAEHLYRVAPLALPDTATLQAARASAAVQLFEQRARALQPSFALDEHNVADVVEICRRLDGLPLAIELAAARVRFLGASGVRERLDQRLQVLTGGAKGGLPRHQTLRETLDWSHGLLTEPERIAFRRLGVFVGSFNLPCAEQVLADETFDTWAVLNHLGGLVDKSMVVAEPPRFRLLESPRAYALEKLRDAGEEAALRLRHAHALRHHFAQLDDEEWTTPVTRRLAAALPDIDNLRAALEWAAQAPDEAPLHIALAAASAWLWQPAGLRAEGLAHLERSGARIDAKSTPPEVEARWHTARVLAAMPLPGASERVNAERAVALYRHLGDRRGLYLALGAWARLTSVARTFEPCEAAVRELETLYDATWPPYSRSVLLTARGYLAYFSGRVEAALPAYEALLQLVTALGDLWMQRTVLIFLEQAMQALGRYDEAARRGRELIAQQRALPFHGSLTMPWANLCQALTELGQLDEALQAGREALEEGLLDGLLWLTLDVFAYLAGRRGRLGDAALAFGCADAEMARRSAVRQPNEQRAYDATLAALKDAMPAHFVSALLTEGAALSVEDAARLALDC